MPTPRPGQVFEHKLLALLARLRTGTALRNLGRPKVVTDPCGKTRAVYEMETDGCGYIIGSIEYQGRGLVHAHLAVRPASLSVRRRRREPGALRHPPAVPSLAPDVTAIGFAHAGPRCRCPRG